MRLAFLLIVGVTPACAQTAEEIMARVAVNQTLAEEARALFVYQEKVLVRVKRANGKLAREEIRDYTVTPTPTGVQRELVHSGGTVGRHKNMDIDADLAASMVERAGANEHSKDGLDTEMFPLTRRGQHGYVFRLEGRERYRDREVFRVTFEPAKQEDPRSWAGEALIDRAEYQPVLVTTHMAFHIPTAVKVMLGFNIRQMGFKITYRKFEEGLWFPVSYGGELQVRALYLYSRTIAVSAINSDFRRGNVQSSIVFW